MTGERTQPFGQASVSLGLYAHDLAIEELLDDLLRQARVADIAGFDGVTVSEHHGGFAGYLPQPMQTVNWMLTEMQTAWSAACPVLLTLRSTGLLIEEIAWLAVRFPGRVGVGFAPGYAAVDFDVAGSTREDRNARFARELPIAVAGLTGRAPGPLAIDPAVAATVDEPVPIVSSAAGPIGARRAGRSGAGIILGAFNSAEKARSLFGVYHEAGGRGPRLLIRRVWVGEVSPGRLDLAAAYQQAGADISWMPSGSSSELISGQPDRVADTLAAVARDTGATCLSVRLSLPGSTADETREQIMRFGAEVLPGLRGQLAGDDGILV